MNLGAMSAANEEIEAAMSYARLHGKDKNGEPYYFFNLVLSDAGVLAGSPEHFSVSGFDELTPLAPRQDKNGGIIYDFDEGKGGYTKFTKHIDGAHKFTMWDTDYNRRFVATHWDTGYWEIEDPIIEDQIYELYLEMQEEAKKNSESPLQIKLKELEIKYKSAKKENKIEIMGQMQGLITENAEKIMPPPKRGLANKAKRQKYRFVPTKEQVEKAKKRPARRTPVSVESKPKVVEIDEQ